MRVELAVVASAAMQTFTDRVAVVTGAASGIGWALANRLAAEGMKVVLADLDGGALATAERELVASGVRVLAVPTDVARAADVEALARRAVDTFGAVHVLCNNAGVAGRPAPIWEQSVADWEWTLGVNLWGVIHGLRVFLPIMLAQDSEGHVVNTASMAGLVSLPNLAPYHATKHAVVTISESLHHELALRGSRLRASVLCPGFVRTRIMDAARPAATEEMRRWEEGYRRFIAAGMAPEDVAARVLDAIREERFWILPHPETKIGFEIRAQSILGERNPMFQPFFD